VRAPQTSSRNRLTADLALVTVTAVWGATFFMIKDALVLVTPFWFMALRFSLAALLLGPFALARPGRFSISSARWGLEVGVVLFLGYALQTVGLQFTSASRSGFITGLAVVFVPLGAAVLYRHRPPAATLAGVSLSVLGMALLSFGAGESLSIASGDVLTLGCALAFTAQILAVGRYAPRVDPIQLTFTQVLVTAVLSLGMAAALEIFPARHIGAVAPAVGFTALFATVGAYYVQVRAQRFTTPTHTALIFALEPVFAAIFATTLGGERLAAHELAGCALILAGMLAAQLDRR